MNRGSKVMTGPCTHDLHVRLIRPEVYSRLTKFYSGIDPGQQRYGWMSGVAPQDFGVAAIGTINLKPRNNMSDIITHNHNQDGVDRRGFLKCMAWAGTGVLWTM